MYLYDEGKRGRTRGRDRKMEGGKRRRKRERQEGRRRKGIVTYDSIVV